MECEVSMALKDKLKSLRTESGMTQETVAEKLGVSSQTVSKWERGLLSPDISLLPKIAILFHCSIDSIFEMDSLWGIEHRKNFKDKIRELNEKNDYEGTYKALISEIELNPEHYGNYADVMFHILKKKMFDINHVQKMISLAEYAERNCTDDDMRNEIYRLMIQICSQTENSEIKKKAMYYYIKLPKLRHSREVYAKFVMEGEEYLSQIKKNIIYMIDMVECEVRQLISNEMTLEEKLYYYKKAAEVYETVLDNKYAGFFDVPVLCDYANIVSLLMQSGDSEHAEMYMNRILYMLERHLSEDDKKETSKLLYSAYIPNSIPAEQSCIKLFDDMINNANFENFKEPILELYERYKKYFNMT